MRAIFILMLIKSPCRKMRDKSKMRDRFVKKYTANILDVKILYV